jgi:spermidine synthase
MAGKKPRIHPPRMIGKGRRSVALLQSPVMPSAASGRVPERRPAPALLAAALLSGTAALVYEVLWARQLVLLLGSTVTAVSAVLGAFMGGLGLGSLAAGLFVDRLQARRLARVYAGLEGAVAVMGPLMAPLAWRLVPAEPGGRLMVCIALVLAPATLMGAALPALAALRAPAAARLAGAAGALHAANTAGAVLGSLGSVLVLLPALGVRGALLAAAALNLLAGVVVLAFARPAGAAPEEPVRAKPPQRRPARPAAPDERAPAAVVLAVLALSGLAALAGEVAWTRVLVLLIGPTPYAFAFILTAVIAGLALGSALAAAVGDRLRRPLLALALVQALAAAGAVAVVRAVGALPLAVAGLVRENADRMGRLMSIEFAGVTALLLPPALCFGASFPIALRALRGSGAPGRVVGAAAAANTAGALIGALVAGLIALPALGMRGTLLAAAGVSAVAAALAALAARSSPPRARLAIAAAAAAMGAASPWLAGAWDRELLSGGAYKYAAYVPPERLESELRAGELVFYREGRAATISVKRLGGRLSLAVDGKVDATTSTDMPTQRLLAHVPLLLHGSARSVCIVGLGSGVTAGSALAHPVRSVEAVEISPEVVEASKLFAHANRDCSGDARLKVVVADGRNHLLLTPRRYDVIISEPSNPWMAGVGPLFAREFFALARSRLEPGGVMCQWAHVYNMRTEDLRTIVAGFTDVFPSAALFLVNEGDVLLLGAAGDLPAPDVATLRRRMEPSAVREDLGGVGVRSAYALASLFALGPPALDAWARDAPRHTDDRPRLELSAPRSIHADTSRANREAIAMAARGARPPEPFASLLADPQAPALMERAQMLERAGSPAWAREVYQAAVAIEPDRLPALEGLVRTSLVLGRAAEAEAELRGMVAREPPPGHAEPRIALALLLQNTDRPADALDALQQAVALAPRLARPLLIGAEIQRSGGNLDAAEGLAAQALALAPADAEAEALLAALRYDRGALKEALERAESVLKRDRDQLRALEIAAVSRARLGDRPRAREAFERLLRLEPDGWEHLNNYGLFELEGGDARAAARWFEQAVELNPHSVEGWEGLLQAARALRDAALLARAERGRDTVAAAAQ